MGPSRYLTIIAAIAILAAGATSCGAPAAGAFQTKSDIKGASLVQLASLPRSPESGPLDDYCEGYRATKLTALGNQVAKLGWIVTSEAPLGHYWVVTFASGLTPGTSGMCASRNSNIGIFDDAKLIALAYTSHSADGLLGTVDPLESGALLILGGDWTGPPVGELREENGGFRLTDIASARTFCNRRAVVPNVYGRRLDSARKLLMAHGWRPLPPSETPGEGDFAADLAKRGVIEAQGCSGTGVGYCRFNYSGAAGTLAVVTIGGDPDPANDRVVSYNVACAAR